MKPFLLTLLLATLCAVASYGQTIKTLGYNTTNGQVVYSGTNTLTFTNAPAFTDAAAVRTNLGLGATWLTNDSVTNFRTAIGLGATNNVTFNSLTAVALYWQTNVIFEIETATFFVAPNFDSSTIAATTRTNLGAARAPIWAYKATNQTNATTNFVSDTALTFTAAANTKYAVELFLVIGFDGDGVAEARISTTNSPTVFGYWNTSDPISSGFSTSGIHVTNAGAILVPDSGDPASLLHKFTVVGPTNTTAPITFQFANQSTNAGSVIIGAGSYLKAEVIE